MLTKTIVSDSYVRLERDWFRKGVLVKCDTVLRGSLVYIHGVLVNFRPDDKTIPGLGHPTLTYEPEEGVRPKYRVLSPLEVLALECDHD